MTVIIKTYQSKLLERFEKMGISLKEISKRSGVSYDILRSIKSKEPVNYRIETLKKICDALNLDFSINITDDNYYEQDEDDYDDDDYYDDEIHYYDSEEREWQYRD